LLEELKQQICRVDTELETLRSLAVQLGAEGVHPDLSTVVKIIEKALQDKIALNLPKGPWLYPADHLTDITERLLASEITREKFFLRFHDELPYATTIETERWRDLKDGSVRIEQIIYVERDSQKAMVIGKGGKGLKAIGTQAREELEELLDRKVHLFIFVKVRKGWSDDKERYLNMGLDWVT